MGLTSQATGKAVLKEKDKKNTGTVISFIGNPNTGKSSIFNRLTGLNQHTGNWAGKTVTTADGKFRYKDKEFTAVDLPGMYSVNGNSPDEMQAVEFMKSEVSCLTVIVADATALKRNLVLVHEAAAVCKKTVLCLNLMDEAERKGICIDVPLLSHLLDMPVAAVSARTGEGFEEFKKMIYDESQKEKTEKKEVICGNCAKCLDINCMIAKSDYIFRNTVKIKNDNKDSIDRKVDNVVLSARFGIPIMILVLGVIFWITIVGANYPSEMLSGFFSYAKGKLMYGAESIGMPSFFRGILIEGMFSTLGWIVSVMLPPMAIFFPLYTILEDLGALPRIAFNLDGIFKKAGSQGKQVLSMCMGFGCNAAGVISCRIIDSPRERLIAILTNNFVPCNGRFPALIAIASVFLIGDHSGASFKVTLVVLAAVLSSVFMTLAMSWLLSKTALKGMPSSFAMELPPYRKPQFGRIFVSSIFDRTIFVLGRAVAVALPMGAVIWLMSNISYDGRMLIEYMVSFFDPFARGIGLDGYILTAFILALPANEIVIPLIIMMYAGNSTLSEIGDMSVIGQLFAEHGWSMKTAVCTMIFFLNHYPCSTALLTIKKETGSFKWTAAAFLLPLAVGIILCFIVNSIWNMAG
ncbi:MAG: ferrous iron transporter B [Firmicutes bacterium]|nr:ferrous iron transporter B [Bacillota bacterium]